MRAIVQDSYGSPELLRVKEVNGPRVGKSQVLVRVCAASLNAGDWRRVRGNPFMVRVVEGLRRPRSSLFGTDLAGVVEELGGGATSLEVGDEVFGTAKGSLAEYVSAKDVARKPAGVSFEEAASVPVAGLTALQALRDKGQGPAGDPCIGQWGRWGSRELRRPDREGTWSSCHRHDPSESADLVATLGAHEVITHDQKKLGSGYDVIIDVGGTPSLRALQDALGPGGKLILVGAGRGSGGPLGRVLGGAIRPRVTFPLQGLRKRPRVPQRHGDVGRSQAGHRPDLPVGRDSGSAWVPRVRPSEGQGRGDHLTWCQDSLT